MFDYASLQVYNIDNFYILPAEWLGSGPALDSAFSMTALSLQNLFSIIFICCSGSHNAVKRLPDILLVASKY